MSAASGAEPGTDRDVLRGAAYAAADKLTDRRDLYAYRVPQFDLVEAVLDHLPVAPGQRVLDVGCGPGWYTAALASRAPTVTTLAVDLSTGMLAAARAGGARAVASADAVALPLPSGRVDHAMANHMLYHVTEIGDALAELRRVVRPGGTLLAVTNSVTHLGALDALLARVSGRDGWWRPSHRFTLENGEPWLAACFDQVHVVRFEGALEVPEPGPIVRFARSMRDLSGQGFDDRSWEALIDDLSAAVAQVIEREGAFRARTDVGVFVCR